MKRHQFLASLIPLSLSAKAIALGSNNPGKSLKHPASLQPGDTVGITAPAGFISQDAIQPAVKKINEWGFKVKLGNTIGKRDFTFAGTDEERRNDFQQLLDDDRVKAILCARGGYGLVRIIDKIDFSHFSKTPKWIIGFSDITVLHCHINRQFHIATLHAKMCNSFPSDWLLADEEQKNTIESIRKCITGEKMKYNVSFNSNNRSGTCSGILVGGNLSTIVNLAGTASDLDTRNKILFVEDTEEYLYSIDRMFWNLKRTGKLQHLKGLIIGGFKSKKDDEGEEFGKTIEEIVREKINGLNYPVCFDFPVGHQKSNYALKCGILHRLVVSNTQTTLTEK